MRGLKGLERGGGLFGFIGEFASGLTCITFDEWRLWRIGASSLAYVHVFRDDRPMPPCDASGYALTL